MLDREGSGIRIVQRAPEAKAVRNAACLPSNPVVRACAMAIADHDLRRVAAAWGHAVEIKQQGDPMGLVQRIELAFDEAMVWAMDRVQSRLEALSRNRMLPQAALPAAARRHDPKSMPRSRSDGCRGDVGKRGWIDFRFRPVAVDRTAGRARDDCTEAGCNGTPREPIDNRVLERGQGVAPAIRFGKQPGWIFAAGVWNRQD